MSCRSWANAREMYRWAKREDISMGQDSYFWGFVVEFAVFSKDQAFPWKMKFLQPPPSAHGWCIEADSLWPAWGQPNRNSYSSTEVNILSHRNTACTPHMWTYAHIVLFSSLFGGRALNFHIAFWICWLGELLEKRWIIRSGCSNSALHPLLLCFYLTSLLITRHRLLALQESCAILSYFITH